MHFDIHVEDQSGKQMLDCLVPKIIGEHDTFRVIGYKGQGHFTTDFGKKAEASKRLLLNRLPKVLSGYGKTHKGRTSNYHEAVIVVCDLDNQCLQTFRQKLLSILNNCHPAPETRFCIAVEEGEAWLLGDIAAIKSAEPTMMNP